MKVLFLIHDDYAAGGLQRSTLAARECMVAGGHDVAILCLKLEAGGLAEQHAFVSAATPSAKSRLGFWKAFLPTLRRHLIQERIDIVVGMGLATSVLARLASLGLSQVRCVGSERAFPPATPAAWHWRLLRRAVFPRLDKIVCQTEQTAVWYRSAMGIQADRLLVIPNKVAPPLRIMPPSAFALRFLKGHPLIACIGRLEPQKGFDMALPIFASVVRTHPDARFLVIGEGPMEREYRQLADSLGIADQVLFLPRVPHLAEVWPAVDVFMLTSRYEGIPNVLAEALAYGKACVAFDCPTGPSELIIDGVSGFLVPLGDCQAAAARCIQLLDDPELRTSLGREAQKITLNFSAERVCSLWNGLLSSLAS